LDGFFHFTSSNPVWSIGRYRNDLVRISESVKAGPYKLSILNNSRSQSGNPQKKKEHYKAYDSHQLPLQKTSQNYTAQKQDHRDSVKIGFRRSSLMLENRRSRLFQSLLPGFRQEERLAPLVFWLSVFETQFPD
jgi:hypothetical protein